MEYSGIKRSLTIVISKYANGILVAGYPKTYDGRGLLITYSPSERYEAITTAQFATMSDEGYQARFAAFMRYVATKEPGFSYQSIPYVKGSPHNSYPSLYDPICLANI